MVGAGLIGGSIARRLARSGRPVTVFDADPAVAERARAAGLVTVDGLGDLVATCDLLFVCTPPSRVPGVWEEVRALQGRRSAGDRLVVTDVASVKRGIVAQLPPSTPADASLVLSHPLAGRETGGFAAASPTLFDGATWIVCPDRPMARRDLVVLCEQVTALGARVWFRSAAAHDEFCAVVSHLPHVMAFALRRLVADHQGAAPWTALAGGSLQDMLRVAGADPRLWSEILADNEPHLRSLVDELAADMAAVLSEGPLPPAPAPGPAGDEPAPVRLPLGGGLTDAERERLLRAGDRGCHVAGLEPGDDGASVELRFARAGDDRARR